ncbi:MAG: solute carrier family 23 protein [Andreesenia angusta]|nr:solute carrier family 23 protein [Andreesenia angusta]
MSTKPTKSTSVFDFYGKPGIGTALPLSVQHVLAMIIGNITPALIIAGTVNAFAKESGKAYAGADAATLVQSALFIAGIATLIQLFPITIIGSRLPVIMGVSFAYIPTLTAVGAEYGLPGILGAQIVGGIVGIIVGIFIKPLRKFFPPLVAGTVVLSIGLSLYPTAIKYIGGGGAILSTPEFGAPKHLIVGGVTLLVVLLVGQFGKGMLKLSSILVGIIVGYIVAIPFDLIDLAAVGEKSWLALPAVGKFPIEFHGAAIISMAVIFVVNSIQAVGDLSATTMGGFNREVTDQELQGGIIGSGLSSVIGAFFGGLPIATYSQNVGIVATTKVVSRLVFALSAIIVLIAGFIPKFGALMTTIPQAVIGGATIGVFASITMSGIRLIIQDELSNRNTGIVGLALALGMGVTSVPELLQNYDPSVNMIFGSSPVVIATLVAVVLNIVFPQKSLADEQRERDEMEAKKEAKRAAKAGKK